MAIHERFVPLRPTKRTSSKPANRGSMWLKQQSGPASGALSPFGSVEGSPSYRPEAALHEGQKSAKSGRLLRPDFELLRHLRSLGRFRLALRHPKLQRFLTDGGESNNAWLDYHSSWKLGPSDIGG